MRHMVYRRPLPDGGFERVRVTREEAIAIVRKDSALDPTFAPQSEDEAMSDFLFGYMPEWEYETDHDPGPWQLHGDGIVSSAAGQIAAVNNPHTDTGAANARLIAAAPALLAVCCRMLNRWDSADGQIDRVDDILAAVEAALEK